MSPRRVLPALALLLLGAALASNGDGFDVRHARYQPGERIRFSSRIELELTAKLLLGFIAQDVSYELLEEETLDVEFLPPDEDGRQNKRLSYPVRRRTTVAPLVGQRTKDRRVAGKSYVVLERDDGPVVHNPDGTPARDKEAREVLRSYRAIGQQPALFELLPAGNIARGASLHATGEASLQLLGLDIDELTADAMQLTLRGAGGEHELVFDATASLSGAADLAGRQLTLSAELSGLLVVDQNTGRMLRLELTGPLAIGAWTDSDQSSVEGSGTLTIRRVVEPGD
jgi:hypothetical protein